MTGGNRLRMNFRLSPELIEKVRGSLDKYRPTMTRFIEFVLWKYFDGEVDARLVDLLIWEFEEAWKVQNDPYSDVDMRELGKLIEKYKSKK